MDPGKQPFMPSCGILDADAAVSAACGAAMQNICAAGYGDADAGGTLHSMLLNTASNCSNWATALQVVNAVSGPAGLAGGTPYLDAAMRTYCSGVGSLTAECGCVAFPTLAAPWCAAASLTCPQAASTSCAALEFAQTAPGSGELQVVQFTTCNPYYCWLADCYAPPQDMLLTSDVLAYQASGRCAGVCGQFVASSTDNIAPMPPGSFSPASITANVSGIGSCGAKTAPALLVAEVTNWVWPVNGMLAAPLFITNDGDYPAQISLTSASTPACTVEPGNSIVLGRAAQQFMVVCDQASVSSWYAASASYDPQTAPQGPPSLTFDAMFEWQYEDLARGGETVTTAPMGIYATILPASGPMTQTVTAVPTWFWLAVGGLALLIVLQLALLGVTKRRIRSALSRAGVAV